MRPFQGKVIQYFLLVAKNSCTKLQLQCGKLQLQLQFGGSDHQPVLVLKLSCVYMCGVGCCNMQNQVISKKQVISRSHLPVIGSFSPFLLIGPISFNLILQLYYFKHTRIQFHSLPVSKPFEALSTQEQSFILPMSKPIEALSFVINYD